MKKLYPYLTYAGTLPFIICAVCLAFGWASLPFLGETQKVLSVYALVITCFMAGSHWGQHLGAHDKRSLYLPILSNGVALAMWAGFLVLPFKPLLATFASALLVLLVIDKVLFRHSMITREYFHTRCLVTAIVISTLVISGIYA